MAAVCRIAAVSSLPLLMSLPPWTAGAQCAHAAVGVMGLYRAGNEVLFKQWERHGQPKIALKVKDDSEMVGVG